MKYAELITYIKSDLDNIYVNFSTVFKMNKEEYKLLIFNLINSFKYNKKLSKKEFATSIFSIANLQELKLVLTKIDLTDEEIKKIIIKSPIIILYSDRLSYIYYLYKNKKYYGYIILDDKEYDTYLLNENLRSNIISNNYITERMLKYYNVTSYEKEMFDNLETDFKLKNYYLKKKIKEKKHH